MIARRAGSLDVGIAALPFAVAVALPLMPLLVTLADVLPRGVAILGPRSALALSAAITLACIVSLVSILLTHGWRGLTAPPLSRPLYFLIATEIVAGIAGVAFRASEFEIISQAGNALAFFAFWWTMGDDRLRRPLLGCFFVSGIATALFAVGLTVSRHPPAAFAYVHGRAVGTFLQPNEFAGYLLFLIPMGIAQLGAPAWLRRLGILAAGAGTVGLALSVSRAAWLGLLLALPILISRLGRRALIRYSCLAVVLLVLVATAFRNVGHDPSENASRITVWRGAVRMAERFALTGVGPVAFGRVYPLFKQPDAQVVEIHAHDLPLNVLVENGLLGLAAFCWVVVASWRAARIAGTRIAPSERERALLFAALSSAFAASAFQNTVDLVTTFVFLLWWPMLGLMLALGRAMGQAGADPKPSPRLVGRALATVALICAAPGLSACNHPPPAPVARSAHKAEPRPQGLGYRVSAHETAGHVITISDIARGRPVYTLRAASGVYSTNGRKGTFSDTTLSFYKGAAVQLTVTAPTAAVNTVSYDVTLAGGVTARNDNRVTLTADTMSYNDRSRVLTARGHVVASDSRGDLLRGERAVADIDLQELRVFGVSGIGH
ncbi:MAG: O-antigen ligase family protein [Candidatus Eremiobacteraeota bacterium]|nr:O-antigen ligase family protein [Candidatus Eremiobacteraeota bacterium]MBC5828244.1 O-antigen ligase family protein [Candidatus Eremiobacteraeota bacterium]